MTEKIKPILHEETRINLRSAKTPVTDAVDCYPSDEAHAGPGMTTEVSAEVSCNLPPATAQSPRSPGRLTPPTATPKNWRPTSAQTHHLRFRPLTLSIQIHPGATFPRQWVGCAPGQGRREDVDYLQAQFRFHFAGFRADPGPNSDLASQLESTTRFGRRRVGEGRLGDVNATKVRAKPTPQPVPRGINRNRSGSRPNVTKDTARAGNGTPLGADLPSPSPRHDHSPGRILTPASKAGVRPSTAQRSGSGAAH